MQQNLNRRQFVKKSATAAAGGLLLSQIPLAAAVNLQGDDAITVALIGCGGRGTGAAAQALSTAQNVKLVAMADAFQDRLDNSLEALKKKAAQGDFGEERLAVEPEHRFVGFDAYEKAIPLADVVILTTPPGFRPIHFEAAVAAGKHIFMEKPLATDAPGIRRILKAAEEAKQKNLNVVVGLQRHYQQHYRELYQKIQKGVIGDITGGQVYWNSEGVWVNPRKPDQSEMEYQMRNWYYFTWLCGDHIVEQHIHNIDVANWFIGSPPLEAQGMGGRQIRTGKEYGEIFDHHYVEFKYPNEVFINSQCRHMPGCNNRVYETFQGTKGNCYVDSGNRGWIRKHNGKEVWNYHGKDDPNPYQVEHDELFANIVNGGPPINNTEYGTQATMTAILGRMATYSGQVITWEDALHSDISLVPEKFSWDALPKILPNAEGYYPVAIPGKTKVI